MIQKILQSIVFCCVGILTALGVLFILGSAPTQYTPILQSVGITKPEVVGFLPYWLISKADKNYKEYITTLTYFGLTLNGDGTIKKLTNPQEEEPGWTTLKKNQFQRYSVNQSLLVITGDDEVVTELLEDPVGAGNNLVSDIRPIMQTYGFTDLNLDIESFMDASESARAKFTQFVQTVKDNIDATVTLDLIPIALVKEKLYDARALGQIVDRVVLMTYDYHYSGSFVAGSVAPLGGAGETIEYDVETAIREALKQIPKEKILLGIPLYGYQWETVEATAGAATIPGGSATASTRRIEEILRSCATCSAMIDPVAKTPYLVYPEGDYFKQTFFENEASMKEKIALVQNYKLRGVALWALGYEDSTILNPLSSYKNTLDLSGLY